MKNKQICWVHRHDGVMSRDKDCLLGEPVDYDQDCYELKPLELGKRTNSCIRVTQENSIEIPLQTNLPYILLIMVCVHYCAPYPKWSCVEHEVNICYPCCMTSFVLELSTLFSQVSWLMLWSHYQIVTDVTVWPITSNSNPSCSKNRKIKIKIKIKLKNKVHF